MGSSDIDVGACVRVYRKRSGLSLKELSERTGIAASNLSAIELSKSSPTLATLIKIAEAFGLKVGAFLDEVIYAKAYRCSVKEGVRSAAGTARGLAISLTGHVPLAKLDAAVLTLMPGQDPLLLPSDQLDRFLYCITGVTTVRVDGEHFDLSAGEGLYVTAGTWPTLAAATDEEAKVLAVYSRVS
ncbi:MAG: helix-turn-helix domain-containing protein [Thermodesulfobacteriota bacterium]